MSARRSYHCAMPWVINIEHVEQSEILQLQIISCSVISGRALRFSDMGAHVDGFAAVAAHTFVVGSSPVSRVFHVVTLFKSWVQFPFEKWLWISLSLFLWVQTWLKISHNLDATCRQCFMQDQNVACRRTCARPPRNLANTRGSGKCRVNAHEIHT